MTVLNHRYVTTSTGRVYVGYSAGNAGDFQVYACTSLVSQGVVGYCACDKQGIFGPLCYTYDAAVSSAQTVSYFKTHKMFEKQK